MKKTHSQARILAYSLASFLFAISPPMVGAAFAQVETIKLKVADSFPAAHYMNELIKQWMADVTEASGNTIEFEYYGAEQLGKASEMLTLVQSGVTDIAYVAPSYVSDKMPLSGVAELPGGFDSSCEGTHAYWKIATGDGLIAKHEMQPNQVRLLFTVLGAPYQILSTKEIDGVSSIKGQKLRSYGGDQSIALEKIGAIPVRTSAPEAYEAVVRGTLDGIVLPYASVFSYKLNDVVKYSTDHLNFGSVAINYVINDETWHSLPASARAAFNKVAVDAIDRACSRFDNDDSIAFEKLKAGGVNMVQFSESDMLILREKMADLPDQWADRLDRRGKLGTEALKAFRAALEK